MSLDPWFPIVDPWFPIVLDDHMPLDLLVVVDLPMLFPTSRSWGECLWTAYDLRFPRVSEARLR